MKPALTRDLQIKILGINPVLKDETGILNPQEIVSLSALTTLKGKSVQHVLRESIEKGENLEEKIKKILYRSSLQGHASMATTPSIYLSYEGSKFPDSMLTGMVFSSSLMSSGRRTETTKKDIVFPTKIFKDPTTRKIYLQSSEKNIDFLNFLLSQEVSKDEASKILQYGIYGTGIIQLSIESIVGFKKECELEKEWMPEEGGILLNKIEEKLRELGIDLLYFTRLFAPRNAYPYPNIFKDPKKENLARELFKKQREKTGIVSFSKIVTPGFKKRLIQFGKELNKMVKSKIAIERDWFNLLAELSQILRDYNSALDISILSSVAWRVWGEKKRHRTVPMIVDSIYYCVERADKIFKKYRQRILNKNLNKKNIEEIDKVFSVPPVIKSTPRFLFGYLECALNSFDVYKKMIKLSIRPADAIFIIPRALKIEILQNYNLFNLISGYYPLRLCQTAEEEMRRVSFKEFQEISQVLKRNKLEWLSHFIVPKCQTLGFCPETKYCGIIKSLVRDYDDSFHQEMKEELEKRLQEAYSKLK